MNLFSLIPENFIQKATSYTTSETPDGTAYTLTHSNRPGVTFIITPSIGTVRVISTGNTNPWYFSFADAGLEPFPYYFRNYIKGKTLAFYAGQVSGDAPSVSTALFGIYTKPEFNVRAATLDKFTIPNEDSSDWNINISAYKSDTGYDITFRPLIVALDSPNAAIPTYRWTPFSNIRPISGFDSVNITRTGENGANPQTATVSLASAGTVYGGGLNLTTGVLTVTRKFYRFDGSENWSVNQSAPSGLAWFYLPNYLTPVDMTSNLTLCNMYQKSNNIWNVANSGYALVKRSDTNYEVCVTDTRYPSGTNISVWKSMLAETPLELLYPLATPVTYQLTPTEITTLLGYNRVSSDAGEINLTYRADPNLSI